MRRLSRVGRGVLPAVLAAAALALAAPRPAAAAPPPAPAPTPAPQSEEDEEEIPAPPEERYADAVPLEDGVWAVSREGRSLSLRARIDGEEDWRSLAKRLCGDAKLDGALAAANNFAAPAPGAVVEAPWELVRPEYRYVALRALFPADRFRNGAWEHRPADARVPGHAESLWQVALWFAGDGKAWRRVAAFNRAAGPELPRGRATRVPASMLLPLFKPAPPPKGPLTFGEDGRGAYAAYRMQKGEAIYSAVVVRFTDFTRPDDVNAAAEIVRERSGVADVRRIGVGDVVKIPTEMLSTGFLPEDDPRRVLARLHEAEIVGLAPTTSAVALAGVTLLLDPGHGGDDGGATAGDVWESDYVFDVACRVKRLVENETSAAARLLVRDGSRGCRVQDREDLPRSRKAVVDTNPPTPIVRGATGKAVNMRWTLANSIFADLTKRRGAAPDKVVFLSLHADSLHKSLRGATVYIPGERMRGRVLAPSPDGGAPRPLPRDARLYDEAVSRRFAEALVAAYRDEGLPVHEGQPVRDRVVRGPGNGQTWLPAVLRANLVPTKALLETVNLGNADDAQLLRGPDGRERIARAIVAGLRSFFSADPADRAAAPAAAPPAAAAAKSTAKTADAPARSPASAGASSSAAAAKTAGAKSTSKAAAPKSAGSKSAAKSAAAPKAAAKNAVGSGAAAKPAAAKGAGGARREAGGKTKGPRGATGGARTGAR